VQVTAKLRMVRAAEGTEGEIVLELPHAAPVESALIAAGLIGQEEHLLLLIDGCSVSPGHQLQDGDVLLVLPRLSGG